MSLDVNPQTSILDAFALELVTALQPYMEEISFGEGDKIFGRGDPGDEFLIIDSGEVRLEAHSDEFDTESVLDYVGPGSFLGEASLLSATPHSLNAYAHTPVTARRVTRKGFRRLLDDDPQTAIDVLRSLGRDTALKLKRANERLAEHAAEDTPDPEVEAMVAKAVAAQREFESWPEDKVDALLKAISEAAVANAQALAEETVEETHIGKVSDKVLKITMGSQAVYASSEGKTGHGPYHEDTEKKVTEIATPVGVIVGLVPITNPVPTFVNKVMIALKSRNAIILSTHRGAQGVGNKIGDIIAGVLTEHGAPDGIVQWIRHRTSRRKTAQFMRHDKVGLILATGGPAMVKAAYSSGKPAIGVGSGNAPAWVAPDADLDAAAKAVILSKGFDNGLICGSEQHLIVDASVRDEFVQALEGNGAVVLDQDETAAFMENAFDPDGNLKLHFTGQTAETIAEHAGVERGKDANLIVFGADASNPTGAQAKERLAPVLSLFTVDGDDQAIDLCLTLLAHEGAGHTANIHTQDEDRIARFAEAMPTSRVLVNVPSSLGISGAVTGLEPSFTLGCGTFGGNSTTDNVTYRNLLNVKRLARSTVSFD